MSLLKLGDVEHQEAATLLVSPLRFHILRTLLGQAHDWHEEQEEKNWAGERAQ